MKVKIEDIEELEKHYKFDKIWYKICFILGTFYYIIAPFFSSMFFYSSIILYILAAFVFFSFESDKIMILLRKLEEK